MGRGARGAALGARQPRPSPAALLAAGDSPDLAAFAAAQGCAARVLPPGLGTRLLNCPIPTPVWFGRAWPSTPALLVPQRPHGELGELDGTAALARTVGV